MIIFSLKIIESLIFILLAWYLYLSFYTNILFMLPGKKEGKTLENLRFEVKVNKKEAIV